MAAARRVLILNTGSSSLKWVVLDAATEHVLQQGDARWQGAGGAQHADALSAALAQVQDIDAVGHRVVHGGETFSDGVRIDDRVRQQIDKLSELAPLHNPAALAGIDAAIQRFPQVPQVAAFDTAFHRDIPDAHALYPVPWDWTQRWHLRGFGFHGLSVSYAVERTRALLGQLPARMVVCHLGAGCSVTAVERGRSICTSMGFTPLEGVMMVQRSGSVDPGMLLWLLTTQGVTPDAMQRALNDQSGLLGVSGVSSDLREVQRAADSGNQRARLALAMFVHRLVRCVGGMVAALNGIDALVFTGGIGEHSATIRSSVCDALAYLGLRVTHADAAADADISDPTTPVRVLVLTAREDLAVLRQVKRVLNW